MTDKFSEKPMQKKELIQEIIHEVCAEFKVAPKELFEGGQDRENLLELIVICLVRDLSGLSPRGISRELPGTSLDTIAVARSRLGKYLLFIPGLKEKYEKLSGRIIKKVGEF